MRWIGIDSHKHYVYVTELNGNGSKENYKIRLDIEGITALKERLGQDTQVIIESSSNSFRLYDELVHHVGRIVIAHPSQTRGASKFHLRNDRVSSEILARLLQSDFVQEVWVPDRAHRALRNTVEYRWALTNMRVATMARIRALLQQEIINVPAGRLMSKRGRQLLEEIQWHEPLHAIVLGSMLRTYDVLKSELNSIDEALIAWTRESADAHLLMTIPGVGPVIAALIVSQIGSIKRFSNPRKLCAYAGIVPRVYRSGITNRTGRITRAGRHLLRLALSLALPHIIRRPGRFRDFHRTLSARRPKRVAHVACARKLLTVIWHMLYHRKPFNDQDPSLTLRKMKALNILSSIPGKQI